MTPDRTPDPEDVQSQTPGSDADAGEVDVPDDRLPRSVADEAERLTRRAREAVDDDERRAALSRRDDLLAKHDYTARLRGADGETRSVADEAGGTGRDREETLVCYPTDWLDDEGRVDVTRIEDTSRGIERPLEGPGEDDWERVEEHNAALVERVREEHGDVHAANARAFADFMGNHYSRRVEEATPAMREEFLTEYFPRNAWPSDEQRAVVEESVERLLAVARAR